LNCGQDGEEKSQESKLYTTEKTYEELLDLANDLRTGSPKHDDHVIAVWIKVSGTEINRVFHTGNGGTGTVVSLCKVQ
jgi:hypothetical protein